MKTNLFKLRCGLVAFFVSVCAAQVNAAPFTLNNVFVSTGVGTVLEYTPTGTLVQTLTAGTGFITGSTFDSAGNLYVTRFSNNAVQKFNSAGVDQGTFGSGYSTPESIVRDASGSFYVGSVGGGIRKFDSAGTFQSSSIGTTRIDFMDLSADQNTMLYTQELGEVRRVNVSTGLALSDFSTAVENAFALRILPNGNVLVADGADIELLDATGAQIGTYDNVAAGTWFALNLDPNGTSFWSADASGFIAHFDISSGALLNSFNVSGTNGTFGLSLYGEVTEGGGPNVGTVPEPGSLALVGLGLLATTIARRRRL